MVPWNRQIREDHQALQAHAADLETALTMTGVEAEQQRATLSWILRGFRARLQEHLRRDEIVLFPILSRLLGEASGAMTLLREQHQELRATVRQFAGLLREEIPWNSLAVRLMGELLIELVDDHDKKAERLLMDVLEFSLTPDELDGVAAAYAAERQLAPPELAPVVAA